MYDTKLTREMAVVYRHIRLDSNQPFYIGIGKTEKRAYYQNNRSAHWKRIVQKHGYKVQIMLDELTYEEAQQKEIEFIQLYGRADLGLGTLINKTNGGEGIVGLVFSKEHKANLSAAQTGKKHSAERIENNKAAVKGKPKPPRTAEHLAKISAALTGKKHSEERKAKQSAGQRGKTQSEETKAKRSVAKKAWWAKKKKCE